MSDTFDPDAWPHSPSGSSRPEGNNPPHDEDDDYDSFDLSQPSGGYGDDDDDDDDYDSAAFGAPSGPRAPASRPGASAYGDEDDEDDYDAPGYGTSYAAPAVPGSVPGSDYEDDYNYDQPARADRGQSTGDDDDYDNSYGNYDSYDDEDPYSAYDDDGGGGGARKLILGALAVVVVLIILGIGYSLLTGKKANNVAQNNTPTTTKATTPANGGTQAVPPADAVAGLNQALTAWGKFAIDGNLNDVKPYFVNGTDQYNQFVAEAPQIQARNVGGAPLAMVMTNAVTVKDNDNEWDFKGTVGVTRTGEQSQSFPWDIQIVRQNAQQPWQVESVRQYQA